MAGSLKDFFEQSRVRGVQMSDDQKSQFLKEIQKKGKGGRGETLTKAEIKKGKSGYEGAGKTDYLSTIGRNYAANQLAKDVRKRFEKKGYTLENGYYVKRGGGITDAALEAAKSAGYSSDDIRSTLAQDFANMELGTQVSKFLGEGNYSRDPNTGAWTKKPPIEVSGGGTTPPITPVGPQEGPYAGIDPNTAQGSTPAEIQYTMAVDPYKIQAKSAERLGRLQQATDLLGKKMAYGTEYDLAKVDRLKALQSAKIQQANYLYNLIPSAF